MTRELIPLTIPAANKPVSLADLKANARITTSAEDGRLNAILAAAIERVEDLSGKTWAAGTYRLELSTWPTNRVIDLEAKASAVTSITYEDANGDRQTWDSANYLADLRSPTTAIYLGEALDDWPDGGDIHISYTDATPEAAKQAILLLATDWFINRRDSVEGQLRPIPHGVQDLITQIAGPSVA